jgi:DNA-binding HxlR family transcriptional regulator
MKNHTPTTCPIAFSLEIFGDKWSLIILRDVLFAEKSHFREFRASPEKISSNILSARLEALVKDDLLVKGTDPSNKSAAIYRPTKKALDLLPMFIELMRWGNDYNLNADSHPGLLQMLNDPEGSRTRIVERFTVTS